jgi:hypothetical protein
MVWDLATAGFRSAQRKVPLEPPALCDDNQVLKFLRLLGLCSDACG